MLIIANGCNNSVFYMRFFSILGVLVNLFFVLSLGAHIDIAKGYAFVD